MPAHCSAKRAAPSWNHNLALQLQYPWHSPSPPLWPLLKGQLQLVLLPLLQLLRPVRLLLCCVATCMHSLWPLVHLARGWRQWYPPQTHLWMRQ